MNKTVVDLCCGAGGFSLGAHLAGFSTLAAVDIDQDLTSSWRMNFPGTKVLHADIQKLDERFWQVVLDGRQPDGVIGGPPCQGFSRIGKRDSSDPRNSLVVAFANQVNIISPLFFVMENVEGILDSQNKKSLDAALEVFKKQYVVLKPMVLNASDYGVPTNRKRVVVVGYKPHSGLSLKEADFSSTVDRKVTVRSAISDLPSPSIAVLKGEEGFHVGKYPRTIVLSDYASFLRSLPNDELGDQYFKNKITQGYVTGLNFTKHTLEVQNRFKKVVPGKVDSVSRFPRLKWDAQAPTLRAGTGKDKGSFQSVRPIHPEQPRVITIREAARIQGFPDWFVFHPTIWHSFRMIGNSVSPIFAENVLNVILKKLNTERELGKG
ncbi:MULTISPECIES: DNA cytosine methyltransferase [unclassified Cobetia]|uniref:DNA cytosine methyltransferase n=1 Tax=unclassified Cobetia TaxID=2609414 RepID=UPI00178CC05A|nr:MULTISPECIES: DNA cytosine methyltransferase [unclassified Cobetia]MBE2167738.1 DNA cytosine methyltransferase [Cobetia sp. 2AS1]MDH2446161.1 DNA cytosine methyltransferase [Cobetia sp. 2AS]